MYEDYNGRVAGTTTRFVGLSRIDTVLDLKIFKTLLFIFSKDNFVYKISLLLFNLKKVI